MVSSIIQKGNNHIDVSLGNLGKISMLAFRKFGEGSTVSGPKQNRTNLFTPSQPVNILIPEAIPLDTKASFDSDRGSLL